MTTATWDKNEAKYVEEQERLKPVNAKRKKDGLPPIQPMAKMPESYVETMMYVDPGDDAPWHIDPDKDIPGTKVRVTKAKTMEEAMEISGLAWETAAGAVFGGPNHELVPDKRAIYRVTDGRVLGIVSSKYQLIQNATAFNFLDSLVADGIMRCEAAMSLYGGKQIVITTKMEEDWTVADDLHSTFLVTRTSHDGSSQMETVPSDYRAICRNSTRMAIANATFRAMVPHRGNIQTKLATARELLKVTTGEQRRYQEWLNKLAVTKTADSDVKAVEKAMFGSADGDDEEASTRRKNMLATFLKIYDAEVEHSGQTGYALFNTVTGYTSHKAQIRKMSDGNERMRSFLAGPNKNLTPVGLEALQEATGVKL